MSPRERTLGALDMLATTSLLLPGVATFYPTFGGRMGVVSPLAGVLVGVALAVVALRLHWRWWRTVLVFVIAYFTLGGVAALPRTTMLGFLPSLETLYLLLVCSAQSWRDLVTVSVPAGDFTGPAVVPWLAGLVAGSLGVWMSTRFRSAAALIAVSAAWLVVAIAFGTHDAPHVVPIGLAFVVLSLVWTAVRDAHAERIANAQILVDGGGNARALLRKALPLMLVLVAASGGAWTVLTAAASPPDRQVIRDYVTPPLRLHDLPSPLMSYRRYEVDLKNETLLTVTGLPAGSRLRLATMDAYDGHVYNVSQDSATYVRVGRRIAGQQISGSPVTLHVTAAAYEGTWVPSTGVPVGFTFSSQRSDDLADGLYYNRAGLNAMTTATLRNGDEVVVGAVAEARLSESDRDALRQGRVGSVEVPEPEGVPAVVGKFAHEHSEQATNPYDQIAALTKKMHDEGYYSDGTDGKSRSGHTTERIASMLSADALVGDDEQYAVALALMGRELGIPTRVVLGFYPAEGAAPSTWTVKGTEAHVWVEANFAEAGWVAFDPTPDRSRIPKTEVPKPRPKPRPEVEPPPDPPAEPAKEPISEDPEAVKDGERFSIPAIVWQLLGVALAGAGVAAPFVLITALKGRRRTRRREADDQVDRVAGAWNEVMDRVRDLGERVPRTATRLELAARLDQDYPSAGLPRFAADIDAGVFGPGPMSAAAAEQLWDDAAAASMGLLAGRPWYRRLAATYSVRSLVVRRRPSSRLGSRLRGVWTRRPSAHRLLRRHR